MSAPGTEWADVEPCGTPCGVNTDPATGEGRPRNERILVNRRGKDGEDAWDTYMACRWETEHRIDEGDALVVYAWRSGVAVPVAEYRPGEWTFVQRDRNLT